MKSLPYLPDGRTILYVPAEHPFMQAAKKVAETESLDEKHRTGAVIVKNEKLLGQGANGSMLHKRWGCIRKLIKAPTGKLYGLCSGCSPKNHAEQKAIATVLKAGERTEGADLYLWGHWWCCQSCWAAMIKAGIKNVYLPDNAWELFGKSR